MKKVCVMGRPKKDAKYLNVYIRADIYTRFAEFCEKFGQSKTAATEIALTQYMNDMEIRIGRKSDDKGESDHE